MAKMGAVYCVYDSSAFLNESVQRIYPLMDRIVFMLNTKPWYGDSVSNEPLNTYMRISSMPDPDEKFAILIGPWQDEAFQRNLGLEFLRNRKIDWCLIVDDDELFDRSELGLVKGMLETAVHAAYLMYHQIYWKNRETVIEGLFGSFPTIARTNGTVNFNKDRMILVNSPHTWFSISANNIVCHHMSYVHSDEEMYRKIKNFSHANDIIPDWYTKKWLNWKEGDIDLHPSVGKCFKRTLSVRDSEYRLQSI